jgi:hypothetical protein
MWQVIDFLAAQSNRINPLWRKILLCGDQFAVEIMILNVFNFRVRF